MMMVLGVRWGLWLDFRSELGCSVMPACRRHYHRIISRLRAETGDGDIRLLFNTASALPMLKCVAHEPIGGLLGIRE